MANGQEMQGASPGRSMAKMSPAIRVHVANAALLQEQPLSIVPRIMFGSSLFCLCVMFVIVMGTFSNWPTRNELDGDDSSPPEVQNSRSAVVTDGPKQAAEATAAALEGEATRRRAKRNGTKGTARRDCGRFSFRYCAEGPSAAQRHYYDWTIGSCVPTSHDVPLWCNRGRNRFASLEHCRSKCVTRKPPSRQCSSPTSFTVCSRRDMKHGLWFWDGDSCVEWNYNRGNCMVSRGRELTSKAACIEACEPSANDTETPEVPTVCRATRSAPCTPAKMRFPFFAARKGGEPLRLM
ncbi:uncharacterized protein LOC125943590 [Dermacentor silvarum]|uniref:uncharacterized protein LOC125943590 n=1 Tax=Dermacentor silvarum TaxID=543639 RepID=UPI0021016DEA|nr:uncharacterized protein LOC125943590 [Dermacentor silvarum]